MNLKNEQSFQETEQKQVIEEFFSEAKRANEVRRFELALILGCVINSSEIKEFGSLLGTITLQGTIDVTGWNRDALRTLLQVCRDRNMDVTIKYDDRYLSPVTLPRDGPLLDSFIEAVFTGKWA